MSSTPRRTGALCLAAIIVSLVAVRATPGQPAIGDSSWSDPAAKSPSESLSDSTGATISSPASLRRILCRYDFEEAQAYRTEFPLNFRNLAEDRGYPKFGRMALSDDAAFGGDWSFRFDLDGSSLAAGVPWGVLPILPYADYVISAKVRTKGIKRARVIMPSARISGKRLGAAILFDNLLYVW